MPTTSINPLEEPKKKYPKSTKDKLKIIFSIIFIMTIMIAIVYINTPATAPLSTSPIDTNGVPKPVTVYFFYGEGCAYCHSVMPTIDKLIQKYPDVNFQVLEIWQNQTNRDLSDKLTRELGQENKGVPLVIIGNVTLLGDKTIIAKLEDQINLKLNQTTKRSDI
jgi:thiol-disulfide isomerase/thioredoxin